MEKIIRLGIMMVAGVSLAACAPGKMEVALQIADDVNTGAGCETFSAKLSATVAQALIDDDELPGLDDLEKTLRERVGGDDGKDALVARVLDTYRVVVEETRDGLATKDRNELLAAVMALEIGDETTPEKALLKTKMQTAYRDVLKAARAAGLDCPVDGGLPPEGGPGDGGNAGTGGDGAGSGGGTGGGNDGGSIPVESNVALPVRGAVKVMTTAYQTCQAKRLPAMTASTTSISSAGIRITGKHENGVGQKREYGDLAALVRTHYYVREGIEKEAGCFDVAKKPLIYDYGGKPYATSKADSTLDFFRDAGTGTTVLGFDCSGYVFSALAVAGLRVAPNKKLTASQVYGINARMYMEPASNGLSCLAPVVSDKTGPIKDGDILASTGHVVMIDRVGADPFGINRLKSASDCVSANVSYKNFDFDVLQSSPVKGGIGIDRMRASDYLAESSSMRAALVQYGVAACKARFGSALTVKPTEARLVRHKLTAECKDTPVRLERESCVASCL